MHSLVLNGIFMNGETTVIIAFAINGKWMAKCEAWQLDICLQTVYFKSQRLWVSPRHWHITVTSWWARWRLKSTASRLFTRAFIQTQIKENIKAPRHWPLCGEFTGDGEFPVQRPSNAENVFIWWRHNDHLISIVSSDIVVEILLFGNCKITCFDEYGYRCEVFFNIDFFIHNFKYVFVDHVSYWPTQSCGMYK